MRSSKSRSRGNKNRNNNRPTGGNIINRVFDSSGPDGKVRGTPQQIIEKYNQLHRDAQLSGDRVAAENFSQHAEHYTRMLAEAMREVEKAREEQEQQNRDRQAERDRERNERLRQQEESANGAGDQPEVREPREPRQRPPRREAELSADPVTDSDAEEGTTEAGLVETPESQPKPRRPRGRKPRPEAGGAESAPNDPAEAAE